MITKKCPSLCARQETGEGSTDMKSRSQNTMPVHGCQEAEADYGI